MNNIQEFIAILIIMIIGFAIGYTKAEDRIQKNCLIDNVIVIDDVEYTCELKK